MFGKNKNYDSILTRIKAVHGLDHDATEAEVDAHLQGCTTYEELQAEAKTEAGKTVQTDMAAETTARTAAEQRAEKAETDLTAAQTENATQKAELAKLRADLATANTRITELENEPAAPPTKGPTAPRTTEKSAWHDSPANVAARALGARKPMPSPTNS